VRGHSATPDTEVAL